jgi:hypothetical protein
VISLNPIILVLGIIVCWIGMFGYMSMKFRVLGSRNFLRIVPNVIPRYLRLAKEEGVPLWPLVISIVCLPLGVIIAFCAILWVR